MTEWLECAHCLAKYPAATRGLSPCCGWTLIRVVESKTEHWAVTVSRNGESIVTLESNCMAGRELGEEDERIIRLAVQQLQGFVGAEHEQKTAGA